MVRIAVVEDEAICAKTIEGYIRQYGKENKQEFEVFWFSDGEKIVTDYRPVYDIIFLDIQMKHLDGMSAAQRIRELDSDVILIFITNMAQYAIRGYSVNALDFLLKPVPYFAFSQELKRSIERLQSRDKSYLLLPTEDGIVRMNVSRIFYIESLKHRITVHTEDGDYSLVETMKDMEDKLTDKHFFRCNSCYLVNLAQVTGVQENCAIVGGQSLQISRPRKKAFLSELADYVGGVVK